MDQLRPSIQASIEENQYFIDVDESMNIPVAGVSYIRFCVEFLVHDSRFISIL